MILQITRTIVMYSSDPVLIEIQDENIKSFEDMAVLLALHKAHHWAEESKCAPRNAAAIATRVMPLPCSAMLSPPE